MKTKLLRSLCAYESFIHEGQEYFKLRDLNGGNVACRPTEGEVELVLNGDLTIEPVAGATLGSLAEGSRFRFGGVEFTKRTTWAGESEDIVQCHIGDSVKAVLITSGAWVELIS